MIIPVENPQNLIRSHIKYMAIETEAERDKKTIQSWERHKSGT